MVPPKLMGGPLGALTVCFVLASSSGEGGSVAVTETAPRRLAASAAATSSAAWRSFMARLVAARGPAGNGAVANCFKPRGGSFELKGAQRDDAEL